MVKYYSRWYFRSIEFPDCLRPTLSQRDLLNIFLQISYIHVLRILYYIFIYLKKLYKNKDSCFFFSSAEYALVYLIVLLRLNFEKCVVKVTKKIILMYLVYYYNIWHIGEFVLRSIFNYVEVATYICYFKNLSSILIMLFKLDDKFKMMYKYLNF